MASTDSSAPPTESLLHSFSECLVSRRGAWVSLVIAVLVALVGFGAFGAASAPSGNGQAPTSSESARVDRLLQTFPGADQATVLVVVTRDDSTPLNGRDTETLEALSTRLNSAPLQVSEDGEAALLASKIRAGDDNVANAETIKELRTEVDQAIAGQPHLRAQVTGGPAFGADVAAAFDGANVTLLLVTLSIVAMLLIVTYRSAVLWLVPLAVVAVADGLAARVTAALGSALDLQFDGGIVSVLVFGAGTNYALLMISRYREQLRTTSDHRAALAQAWRATFGAILASNLTVVLALASLFFAITPGTHGLGVASAAGLLVAVVAVLFVLPSALAICGRKVFWPLIPQPGHGQRLGRNWRVVALQVIRRPVLALGAGLALLAVLATGLFGTSVGLNQVDKFRVHSDSAVGLTVLAEHFPAGMAQPLIVLTPPAQADAALEAARAVDGVVAAQSVHSNGAWDQIMVTGQAEPGTSASLTLVDEVRDAVNPMGALVGGATATDVDAREANARDLALIAPMILAISLLVLIALMRSLLVPVAVLVVNAASALAAIGAGSWLSKQFFDQSALDLQVPLLAFLFLVALGIDYTIFLLHRFRADARTLGTRAGLIEALGATGGVITSAGVVLAGVFAALGVLPLVTLGQLGLIVGLGVLIDTFVVRSVVVPAILALSGARRRRSLGLRTGWAHESSTVAST